ncbi:hypothetical protein K474DRAFT_1584910 [Panus rudis PR-1116 ss-1]|nr:hypothetical protein K474DRAFT_1584910 [Panus rudis PR-1116 ss-1]
MSVSPEKRAFPEHRTAKRPRPHTPQPVDNVLRRDPTGLTAKPNPTPVPADVKPISREEFMSLLRPPNSSDKKPKQEPEKYPPLTLATPELVAKHTPCTLHLSILPPELASRLFWTMLDLSHDWQRNRWYLFDRLVESPHKTSFFIREQSTAQTDEMREAAKFWYNGRMIGESPSFPPEMEEACKYIERVVNAEMHKRQRYPLEWGGELPQTPSDEDISADNEKIVWRANVAASNCYEGAQESVGFHTDALTYLGPYPTIASLSLGTTRTFRLREVIPSDEKDTRSARTFNIPLSHNSLTIMHASCQETFKHSVPPQRTIDLFHAPFRPPPSLKNVRTSAGGSNVSEDLTQSHHSNTSSTQPGSNARINITFRFFRPDYRPSMTPKCKCGVPCILRPDMKSRYSGPTPGPSTTDKGPAASGPRDTVAKYWWTCHAGAQNEGKGCGLWKVMDAKAEGRGPFAGHVS